MRAKSPRNNSLRILRYASALGVLLLVSLNQPSENAAQANVASDEHITASIEFSAVNAIDGNNWLSAVKPIEYFFSPAVTGSLSPSSRTVGVTQVSIVGTASPNATVTANPEIWPDGTSHGPFSTTANSSGSYSMGPFVLQQLGTYTTTLRDSINGSQATITYSGSGNFSLSRSPSSRTINPGQSASFTVTINSVSNFAGTVNLYALNWGNIPNATASWSPSSVSLPSGGSRTATFTINTSSNTPPGTYGNIILRGTNGSAERDASAASVIVQAPTVNLTASLCPSSPTVGVTNVSICGNATPNSTVTANPEIWPDGTSHGPFSTQANGSGTYSMGPFILQQLGQYTATMRDSISGQQLQFPYSGQGNFSASVNATSRTVNAGQPASYTVTFTSQSGFAGTVIPAALNWSQVPGATASWSPSQVTVPSGGQAQSTFTIQTAASTPAGTYSNITLQGANGSQTRTAPNVSLIVQSTGPSIGNYSWNPNPPNAGQSFNGTITGTNYVTGTNNTRVFFCVNASSTCFEHPQAGVNVTSSSNISITNAQLAAGSWQFYVQTAAGTSAKSTPFTVQSLLPTVDGYSWSPNPPTAGQNFGGTISGTRFVSGPNGTRVFFCPVGSSTCYEHPQAGVNVTSSTNISISNANLGPGSYQVYVKTSVGSSNKSTAFSVSAVGNFNLSVSPATRTIARGEATTYLVSLTSVNGFVGNVNLFALNLPGNQVLPGTGFTPMPVNLTANGTKTSTFKIVTNGQSPTGTFPITIRAQSGSIQKETPISLTINASSLAPTIANINPPSVTYGQETELTVTGTNFTPDFQAIVYYPDGSDQIAQAGLTYASSSEVKVKVRMLGSPPYDAQLKILVNGQSAIRTFSVAGSGGPAPTISQIISNPSPVPVGTPTWLTVRGENFVNEPEISVSWPNCGGSCPRVIAHEVVLFDNSNQVRVQVDMGGTPPYQATLHLKNPDQQSTARQFSVGGASTNLELFGLEVTQGVQNLANQVELLRSKPTWVRAHVRIIQSLTGDVVVNARLIGRRLDGSPLPGSPLSPINTTLGLNTGSIRVKTTPQRVSRNDSFLFALPHEWTTGTVEMQFEGTSHSFIFNEPDGSNDGKVRLSFNDAPSLRIKLVSIEWTGILGEFLGPTAQALNQARMDLRNMIPSSAIQISSGSMVSPSRPYYTQEFFTQILVPALMTKRLSECGSTGAGCRDYYLGLLNKDAPFVDGSVKGYASTNYLPLCRNDHKGDVAAAFFFPINNGFRFTHVHEFGHLLGRYHTDFRGVGDGCGHFPSDGTIGGISPTQYSDVAVFGFDGINSFPSNSPDVMTTGDPNYPYISRFTYERMLQHSRNRFSTLSIHNGLSVMATEGEDVLLLVGNMERNNPSGRLSPVFKLPSPSDVPVGQGDSRIVFYDSDNGELASYQFEADYASSGDVGIFALLLPQHSNAAKISLVRGGNVLDSKLASPNVPTVTLTSPNGGEVLAADSATIDWTASDLDGDPLAYLVQFSSDNGTTWTTLVSNWTETSFPFDLRTIAGTSQGKIRILASDGFHTGQDQSNTAFTVIGGGPTVDVVTPIDNAGYVGDQPVVLEGNATDLEDGELSGAGLKWTSNLDGQLGTGSLLTVNAMNLTEGTHRISLSAQDSDGYITTSTVTVRIFRSRPVLPASLSLAPSQLRFISVAGSGLTAPQVMAVRNDGDGELSWTASASEPWIQLSTTSGTAPGNPEIRINRSGLSIGSYSGTVTISTQNAANSPQTISVSLSIVEPGMISISGQAFDRFNRGLRTGIVTLTDSSGLVRHAVPNTFGHFRFMNVPRGETYTITVRGKGTSVFQPLVLQPFSNVESLVITADP